MRWRTLSAGVPAGLLAVFCFLHATAGAAKQPAQDPNSFAALVAPAAEPVRRQILDAAMAAFAPSLEMKENAGFLLTPALLVQEIVSDDVLVTYPCE